MRRRPSVVKKNLPCLRCGRVIYTYIGQRFCARCRRANREAYTPHLYRSPE